MRSYEITENKISISKARAASKVVKANGINQNYTGPAQEVVESSSSARLANIGFLGQYEYLREEVKSAEKIFIRNFFKVLKGMHDTIDVNWVTACKSRHQELFDVFSAIVQQSEETEVVILTRSGKVLNLDQLTYAPKRYLVKGVDIEDEILDIYISNNYPKMYAPLFVAMFKVSLACQKTRESEPELFAELKSLAFSLYERGGLYNETNPDKWEWRRQEQSTLDILTKEPTRKENERVKKAFNNVLRDIREGIEFLKMRHRDSVKPYVLEICQAIVATERYCHSSYTDDDLYLSMAADAAKIKELSDLGIRSSLLKSALEVDPLCDCEFDKHVEYVSHYNKGDYKGPWIITIQIPNPGKFKTRSIHLTISAIQDRCAYIHNRLAALLARIPSDCTKDQSKGIRFTLQITDPTWRENRNWPSVLAYDWSNATDKLWSYFQEAVLGLIFDKEVVDFWHLVSSCDKEFRHKDGSVTPYHQVNGQPQGLLGSFDAFALAHHIIMLMTMQLSDKEDILGSQFYRVLGDDSIICSVTNDKYNIVGNMYMEVCEWCNVPINIVKSTQVLWDQPVALVEFAKIHALNGEYFSPIPERLANRIGKHNQDYYAFAGAFWGQRHGMDNRGMIESLIDRYYQGEDENHLAKVLMFSGIIPSYADLGFSDPVLSETEEAIQLALCYWYNKIKATFALNALSDKAKERLNFADKEMKDALLEMIPEQLTWLFDRVQDHNHKLMKAIEQNLDKESVIKQLLDCSSDQALVIAASVKLTVDEANGIMAVVDMIETLTENPAMISFYNSDIRNLDSRLKSLERLNYRSVYKRDSLNSKIFRSTLETYFKLFSAEGCLSYGT